MLIYMVTNKLNGKQYIGQTIRNFRVRINDHINKALSKENNMAIGRAIRKYGRDNFDWTILHDNITNIDILNKLEIFYIGYYNTFEGAGYNCTAGGYGALPSDETRKRLAIAARNRGPISKETSRRISESVSGKNNYGARPVIINNKYFDTCRDASKFIKVSHPTIRCRILHKTKWIDYKYA